MSEEFENEIDQRRERSPSFPYLELSVALDLARRLLVAAKQSEVRLSEISSAWGTTPTSGSLLRYVAALQAYGLIDSSGSGPTRKIRLSDAARRILSDARPGIKERLSAEAALKPRLMSEIFAQWASDRPDDDIAKSQLQFDYRFTSDAARRFLVVYDSNLEYVRNADLLEPSRNEASESVEKESNDANLIKTVAETSDVANPSPTMISNRNDAVRRDVFTLEEGEVVLIMPSLISHSSFEDFSDWLDLMKRKIQRNLKKIED
ncbi:hypothetical protein ACQZ6F_22265 [Rhizobium sp. A22-96]